MASIQASRMHSRRADGWSRRGRLAETEGQATEFTALKEEREQVRTRVAEMLAELEALNL